MHMNVRTVATLGLVTLLSTAASASAANLNLTVTSNGGSNVIVPANEPVEFEVVVELTDTENHGLAGVLFDLQFSGGPLTDALEPGPAMTPFISPNGLTNPAGFGGTLSGDLLIQVGGLQNTVNNKGPMPSQPTGNVVTGIGHTPVVTAIGTLSAPAQPGTYALSVTNVLATAIVQGSDGNPFWPVENVNAGTVSPLSITVIATAVQPLPDARIGFAAPIACAVEGDCPNLSVCIFPTNEESEGQCYAPVNRYLGVAPSPANTGTLTARRVSIQAEPDPIIIGWIGEPDNDNRAPISSVPFYADWNALNAGDPLLAYGCQIVPNRQYLIQSIEDGRDIANEINYSSSLVLPTVGTWADVTGPGGSPPQGVVNFEDILAVVLGFQLNNNVPNHWLDISGEVPNAQLNFEDIQLTVNAFSGDPYPFSDPCTCVAQDPCP